MEDTKRSLLNKEQASCHLDISTRSLDRIVKKGKIVPIKKGKIIRFVSGILPTPEQARLFLGDNDSAI